MRGTQCTQHAEAATATITIAIISNIRAAHTARAHQPALFNSNIEGAVSRGDLSVRLKTRKSRQARPFPYAFTPSRFPRLCLLRGGGRRVAGRKVGVLARDPATCGPAPVSMATARAESAAPIRPRAPQSLM